MRFVAASGSLPSGGRGLPLMRKLCVMKLPLNGSSVTRLTDFAPWIPRKLSRSCVKNRFCTSEESYCFCCSQMWETTALSGLNPGLTPCTRHRLRSSRPAPHRRTSESASSPTMRAWRRRFANLDCATVMLSRIELPLPAAFSSIVGSKPKRHPVKSETPRANASTQPSIAKGGILPRFFGFSMTSACCPQ